MSEERWLWRCDRVISSKTSLGRVIIEEVLAALRAQDWDPHDIFGVHVALEEALVNAIKHGNHFSKEKQVRVGCGISATLVRIEISDEGDGFNPVTLPDPTDPERLETPSGRGVKLMRSFMSRVSYNTVGNSVVLEKERDANKPSE